MRVINSISDTRERKTFIDMTWRQFIQISTKKLLVTMASGLDHAQIKISLKEHLEGAHRKNVSPIIQKLFAMVHKNLGENKN